MNRVLRSLRCGDAAEVEEEADADDAANVDWDAIADAEGPACWSCWSRGCSAAGLAW